MCVRVTGQTCLTSQPDALHRRLHVVLRPVLVWQHDPERAGPGPFSLRAKYVEVVSNFCTTSGDVRRLLLRRVLLPGEWSDAKHWG